MVATSIYSHNPLSGFRGSYAPPTLRELRPEPPLERLMDYDHIKDRLPFPAAMQRLDVLSMLPPDWDTYNAKPISSKAIEGARGFLRTLANHFIGQTNTAQPYFLAPLPYGGVQMEWRNPGSELEIEIGPDGNLSYLLVTGHGDARTLEERDVITFNEAIDHVIRVCNGE